MPLHFNQVILAGSLTRDPEIRFVANEKALASFGMAVNHRWKTQDGEQKEDTLFVDVEAWGRQGELAGQYCAKGRNVQIVGRLKLELWDDKVSGHKRSKIKVVADRVYFLGDAKPDSAAGDKSAAPAARQESRPQATAPGDDEPPF